MDVGIGTSHATKTNVDIDVEKTVWRRMEARSKVNLSSKQKSL